MHDPTGEHSHSIGLRINQRCDTRHNWPVISVWKPSGSVASIAAQGAKNHGIAPITRATR